MDLEPCLILMWCIRTDDLETEDRQIPIIGESGTEESLWDVVGYSTELGPFRMTGCCLARARSRLVAETGITSVFAQ